MPALNYPKLNGQYHSWASLEIVTNTKALYGGKSLDYSDTCEPGEVRGNARAQLIGRTLGDYKAEASLELFLPEAEEFEIEVSRTGSLFEAVFVINAAWTNGVLLDTIVDNIVGCRIKSISFSGSQGSDAATKKYDLAPLYIVHNGRIPLGVQQFIR